MCCRFAHGHLAEVAEHVVVAGGGVVVIDFRLVDAHGAAGVVDAASHPLAVTAADASGTTAGSVVNDIAAA